MQNKPNRKDNKGYLFRMNENFFASFDSKSLVDGFDKKAVLETAVRAYINGEATTVTKDGKEIFFKCEVK